MAAEELVGFDKLRERLSRLDETKGIAQRELQTLNERKERIAELEHDRDTLVESYTRMTPEEGMDLRSAQERHRVTRCYDYRYMRRRAKVYRGRYVDRLYGEP